jgi:benzoate-CoA ligase
MPAVVNLTCAVLDETLEAICRSGGDPASLSALREPKRAWSYGKLHEEACRVAGALRRQGLRPGDRIVLLLHNGVEMAAAILGAVRAGLCAVPLPDTLRPRELLDVLCDSGARAVVAHADLAEMVAQVDSGAPDLTQVLTLGGSRPGQVDFAALCFDEEARAEAEDPRAGVPALLLYQTSPDGRMRAHAYPHDVPLRACTGYCNRVLHLTPEDRVFSTSRLASTWGLPSALLCPLRAQAVSFLLPEKGRGRAVFDVLGSFRPTVFSATPTLYGQLVREFLEMSAPRPAYFKTVRLALSGAEPLPTAVERRVRGVFQVELLNCFVSAEAFGVVLCTPSGDGPTGSCGRPLPEVEVRVLGDRGEPARAAEIGPLQVRGEQVRGGLWCGVTRSMLPPDPGWVTLGDRFFVDEAGQYFFAGRSDGMFKVDGRLVAPVEVERTLLGHPAVWQCAVAEGEDEDGLPLVKAFVVLNVGFEASGKLARELIDQARRQLSPHKAPQAVEFVDSLPRGVDGRVARWRLRSRPPSGPLSPPRGLVPLKLPEKK